MNRRPQLLLLLATALCFGLPAPAQTFWGIKARWGVQPYISHIPVALFKYVYGSSSVTVIDSVRRDGQPIDIDGLACLPSLGLVAWEVKPAGSQMVLMDSTTATVQDFGAFLPGRQIRGACFDRVEDIYALDHAADELLHIQSADGSIMTSVPLSLNGGPFDLGPLNDLDQIGDAYYMHAGYTLYQLNTQTGSLTPVFTDTLVDAGDMLFSCAFQHFAPYIGGIAELPHTSTYIALDANCEDDLYQYDVLSLTARLELVNDITPGFNSGAEDLALAMAPSFTAIKRDQAAYACFSASYRPGDGVVLNAHNGPLRGMIEIYDGAGRRVIVTGANGTSSQRIETLLPTGLYSVSVSGSGGCSARIMVP